MKAVVVYESFWGNTADVARAIAEGIGEGTPTLATDEATAEALAGADLLVVGAPLMAFSLPREQTREDLKRQGKAPTPADLSHPSMRSWLAGLPAGSADFATFETRFKRSPGSATKVIDKALTGLGYKSLGKGERFLITGSYGPMADGELDRARAWGAELRGKVS